MKLKVMVNGLPGNMARLLANAILADDRFSLMGFGLTGPNVTDKYWRIKGRDIILLHPETDQATISRLRETFGDFVAADFTQPDAVIGNAELYCREQWPFIMGTTGGDRQQLADIVNGSSVAAVIAPNMAKQIVLFQAMLEYAAKTFPGTFRDYTLEVVKSHQSAKKDVSGTAKALLAHFNGLGIPFAPEQIIMIRDPEKQLAIGVPDEALGGHGWHTYTLRSPGGDVLLRFTHNINGRDIYVRGAMDALLFLKDRQPGLYSMIDVLKANNTPA